MKHHRLASHIASISFIFFWAFWILTLRTANYDMWNLAVLVFVIYGTVTWFIGIHVDAAEGLQTSYLAELELEGEHQYMHRLLPVFFCHNFSQFARFYNLIRTESKGTGTVDTFILF